jgi:hypothetical protein
MAGELLVLLRSARVDCVVADARDGYNPMHDVCRLLVDHVLLRLRDEGRPLLSFGFALVGPPEPAALSAPVARIDLDESAHRRKLEAACGYPELEGEVAAALRSCGADALRHEYLSLASYDRPDAAPDGGAKPYYETYGERQVAAGRYATVLRYERHVRPLVETLAREAGR